jgi:hypothetical protein
MCKTNARLLFLTILAALMLSACATSVFVKAIGPNQYEITASAGGMIGAAFRTKPSLVELKEKAEATCVDGYDKISERIGHQYETEYIQWHITCRRENPR